MHSSAHVVLQTQVRHLQKLRLQEILSVEMDEQITVQHPLPNQSECRKIYRYDGIYCESTYQKNMGTLIIADTPALCRAVGSTWVGRSVPDTGFNVPITSNDVSPGLRLVFGRPQCAFQMALQTASAGEKQVLNLQRLISNGTIAPNYIVSLLSHQDIEEWQLKGSPGSCKSQSFVHSDSFLENIISYDVIT
ncbi:hypothetical protein Q9966_005548 [Columba livia]|nr:hypothetical protein Q9966_005548 [Columba livia]